MTEWFVYCNTPYYPWAEIVTAETPQQAAEAVASPGDRADGIVVVPFDAIAYAYSERGDLFADLRE